SLGDETAIKVGYVIDEMIGDEVCVLVIASTGKATVRGGSARKSAPESKPQEVESLNLSQEVDEAPTEETPAEQVLEEIAIIESPEEGEQVASMGETQFNPQSTIHNPKSEKPQEV